MINAILDIYEYVNPGRIFGPIFIKEQIVSSRRRRNYFSRFIYIVLLALFVASIYSSIIDYGGRHADIFQKSRMALIGIEITTSIVWFQFLIVQLFAMIMLSSAISDEIYNKTLGVLMTTPIKSYQIVFGKLLSKLLQLLLIVSISFPVLAIIRVFGGVPWDTVLASVSITLASAIFAGSLSLFFSINNRTLQQVISKVLSVYALIYVVPFALYTILNVLRKSHIASYIYELGFFFINPFIQMLKISGNTNLIPPSGFMQSWILHCLTILGFSLIVLLISAYSVRKAGLRQITGQAGLLLTRRERKIADKKKQAAYSSGTITGKIRDIKYPPVIWREIANPLIKKNRIRFYINTISVILVLIAGYLLAIIYDFIFNPVFQIAVVIIYIFFGLLHTSAYASTCITSEKESRTWPILLTSPIDSGKISLHKIIGSAMRAWPTWLLLSLHMIVFISLGTMKVFVLVPLLLIIISCVFLFSSLGVMFSSLCKRNSTSSILNIITFIFLVIPACCLPMVIGSPLFAIMAIFVHWAGFKDGTEFFSSPHDEGFWFMLLTQYSFIYYMLVYLIITLVAYFVSSDNIRRRIFR